MKIIKNELSMQLVGNKAPIPELDMKNLIHKGLTLERWSKFTILEQLANVGCDVDRAIRHRSSGDLKWSRLAFERAMELLAFTIADPKNQGARLKELSLVREALIDYFLGDNMYSSTDEQWQSYFYQFNYAAAVAKGK
jgi:hypothetical protein